MRGTLFGTAPLLALALVLSTAPRVQAGITIQFDYTYDTGGFFTSNPQAATLLNDAAQFLSSHLTDSLTAINPSAQSVTDHITDTWTTFDTFNPSDPNNAAANITITDLNVPANTLIIYVGGATSLPGNELGFAGPGGWQGSGSQAWIDILHGRGQAGALAGTPTDFGPWGGAIAFSSTATWYFDSDPSTNDVPGGKNDFYSVALHELGHVLGIGTAQSWDALISGGNFTGAHAEALNGGSPVALSPDLGHWAEGTTSTVFLGNTTQEVAMDPTLTVGTRKYFTTLDEAGLQDVGWAVVPEPAAWPWLATGVAVSVRAWRRKRPDLERDERALARSV
ncbi:MAG TPA: hypothetical protein VHC95_02485 [Opitutales bacterium]|nr:hypothetical protein [Opitutales bacterium]